MIHPQTLACRVRKAGLWCCTAPVRSSLMCEPGSLRGWSHQLAFVARVITTYRIVSKARLAEVFVDCRYNGRAESCSLSGHNPLPYQVRLAPDFFSGPKGLRIPCRSVSCPGLTPYSCDPEHGLTSLLSLIEPSHWLTAKPHAPCRQCQGG
jgi:hypothetical protein